MARIYHRPTTVNDYGSVNTIGGGNVLGDNNNSTYKQYSSGSEGSVGLYPEFNPSRLGGKPIIAVRAGHVERQNGFYNGWVMSYLRINGQRYEPSRVYRQDGFSQTWREKLSAPVYKGRNENWTVEDINGMTTDTGGASGDFGPVTSKKWCLCSEMFILVVTAEPLPTPTVVMSASVSTTNPTLYAILPAAQPEQSSMMTFEVARDSSFTDDLRSYNTAYRQPSDSLSTTYAYSGAPSAPSYADLGPGLWYIRSRATDIVGQNSEWSASKTFTVVLGNLPTPSLTKPVPGSSSSTPYMVRAAFVPTINNAPYMPGDRAVGAEWEFAPTAAFDTGVVRWRNVRDGVFVAGNVEYNPSPVNIEAGLNGGRVGFSDPDQKLPQGTIHGRVRAADKWGNVGQWSSSVTFTVDHKPFARNVSPTGGEDFDPTVNAMSWEFADPWGDDRQTAYRVVVKDGSLVVSDTGKRFSTATSTTLAVSSERLGKVLTYEVTLWDSDDVAAATPVTSTFKYRRAPIVTVAAPVGEIDDGLPTVSWSSVFSESKVQSKVRIIVQNKTSGRIDYDSGTLVTSATSHKITKHLPNVSEFDVRVYVYDSGNLMGMGMGSFSTNFVLPPTLQATVLDDRYVSDGYVEVMWSGAVDPFFYEYRIYRRDLDEMNPEIHEWEFAGSTQDGSHNSFRDYTISGMRQVEYAVTQVSYRFGSTVESLKRPTLLSRASVQSSDYWLIVPGNESASIRLHSVVDDSYTDKTERNSYQIVGGGTRVTKGSHIGIEGSLSCQVRASTVRGAREQVKLLRSIGDINGHLVMRDPFGNATKVSIGDLQVKRIKGVGPNEFADIEVPYTEVR